MEAANHFYVGAFYTFYEMWLSGKKTMVQSGEACRGTCCSCGCARVFGHWKEGCDNGASRCGLLCGNNLTSVDECSFYWNKGSKIAHPLKQKCATTQMFDRHIRREGERTLVRALLSREHPLYVK